MKSLLTQKVKSLADATLLEMLSRHKKELANWKAWGDNTLRVAAEEASRRGLI